jgi:exodeoxyribonuclease V alpha subunit
MIDSEVRESRFRVTSVIRNTSNYVIFMGAPLDNSNKVFSAKTLISIMSKKTNLPVEPAIGQHWTVKDKYKVSDFDSNGYIYKQLTYEDPVFAVCTLPETGEQFIKFIAYENAFKGIGNVKARELWEYYDKEIYAMLSRNYAEDKISLSKMLSDTSIEALYEGFKKYSNLKHANWMSKKQIPSNVQQSLLKFHGDQSIKEIQRDPFKLMSFGMSFKAVSKLAKSHFNIVNDDDERRLSAVIEEALRASLGNGNTFSSQNELKPIVRRLLGCMELTKKAFQVGFSKSQYIIHPEHGTYHQSATLIMEGVITKRFKKLASFGDTFDESFTKSSRQAIDELPYPLVGKQQEAVVNALAFKIACITGGAGTGKTTVLRTVLRAMHFVGYTIHAIALSGRAAMRMHESIGFATCTIAAFLRKEEINDDGKHIVVIDEASMVDIPTMYRIVTHIHPNVRILFVGDPNQLPPIGPGKVLADVINSGTIMNTTLDIVKRQEDSTGIPEYSAQIRDGIVPDNLSFGNITFHETPQNEISAKCVELYSLSPEDSRVIGATYDSRHGGGINEINYKCQEKINPDGNRLEIKHDGNLQFVRIKEGDPVLFTKNNYEIGVQNGSLGVLTSTEHVDDKFGVVTLDTIDEEQIALDFDLFTSIKLGYAISLHKAQGSQFPRIIISLIDNERIVDKSWLYTAITRAETEVHIVGTRSDFVKITQHESNANKRNSFLGELLSAQNIKNLTQ